jgi:glucose-1-phosphate thymidylyltransferase
MNCYRFEKSIFDACRKISPSTRGELELTDAVQYTIDVLKNQYTALTIYAPVLDMSCRADVPAVAAKLKGRTVNL